MSLGLFLDYIFGVKFMKKIALLAFWGIEKVEKNFYMPMVHYVYIKYIVTLYNEVYLLAPVRHSTIIPDQKICTSFLNFHIIEMPDCSNYLSAQRYEKKYKEAVVGLANVVDVFYSRVPDPFSWVPALYTSKPCIMHFVGDIIDATKHNIKWSWWKKRVMLVGYLPEQKRVEKAARKSIVYANGVHLSEKLKKKGIDAIPVISSTVSVNDFPISLHMLQNNPFRLVYIGYLRYAKGIDTLMKVILLLKEQDFEFTFDIIGNGEMYTSLVEFVKQNNLSSVVKIHGHIDDRKQILSILRHSDLFFFPSLSEGSPRVVIEAMSQGVPVLSTPVGSLPCCFEENKEIVFFPYNDAKTAVKLILKLANLLEDLDIQRKYSFERVKDNFTIDRFLHRVFSI